MARGVMRNGLGHRESLWVILVLKHTVPLVLKLLGVVVSVAWEYTDIGDVLLLVHVLTT